MERVSDIKKIRYTAWLAPRRPAEPGAPVALCLIDINSTARYTATNTAPRRLRGQKADGERDLARSGCRHNECRKAPYRPHHEPSAMPARSKTPTEAGARSRARHVQPIARLAGCH